MAKYQAGRSPKYEACLGPEIMAQRLANRDGVPYVLYTDRFKLTRLCKRDDLPEGCKADLTVQPRRRRHEDEDHESSG